MTPADPTDPHAWLTRAYSNLRLAEKGRGKDVMLEDLCFNAQQAAEKPQSRLSLQRFGFSQDTFSCSIDGHP